MTARRSWLPLLVAVVVIAAGVVAVLVRDRGPGTPRCASAVAAHSPLVAPTRFGDDEHLTTLASSVDRMGPPFGAVRAGVGFNYGQWLHLYGVAGGVLAFTKDNPELTLLDEQTLKPRWALRPESKRIAWDTSDDRLILLDLARGKPTRVASYDLADGTQGFCVELPAAHAAGQPVATALVGADLVVALPAEHGRILVTRVGMVDGRTAWTERLAGVSRADFLAEFVNDLVLVGGTEEYRLAQVAPTKAGSVLAAVSSQDGSIAWRWEVPAGTEAHVVGVDLDHVLVMTRSARGPELVALDQDGQEVWRRAPAGGGFESTLRGHVLLTRSRTGLAAYDARTGTPLWTEAIPTDRTFFPYGFTLGQMPSLDPAHLLVPTTTSLEVLDVRTGRHRDFPLPTDGVSTTYWPYQLVSTARLLGVVTNTGGVLAGREVGTLR